MAEVTEEGKAEYLRLQAQWAKEAGVKKGDTVVLMTKGESGQGNWPDEWCEGMDELVGKDGEVIAIDVTGIIVGFPDRVAALPFFALVKA